MQNENIEQEIKKQDNYVPPYREGGLSGARWFFNNDNPLWTLFPIILSVLALWFAYKSNYINREIADVHLRITTQVFRAWTDYQDYIFEDNVFHFQGTIGSLANLETTMDSLQLASNDLGMRWLAESANMNPEDYSIEDMPFMQHYIFLAIRNDGDQIAEELSITFDYYNVEDDWAFRTELPIPDGVEPEEWTYGPALLAPGQWVLIPLGSCFIRMAPGSDEFEAKYVGDFYNPKNITYVSAVSGQAEKILDIDTIPKTMNAFTEPPMPEEGTQSSTDTNGSSGNNGSSGSNGTFDNNGTSDSNGTSGSNGKIPHNQAEE